MPKDSAVAVAGPWPSTFPATFVEHARDRLGESSLLLVVGPTGTGRTLLAGEITLPASGSTLSRHAARPGDQDLERLAVSQLFDSSLRSMPDLDEVERWVAEDLRDRPATPHVVLAEAHLCDADSLEVLTRLATRRLIRLVATTTPEGLRDHPRLAAAGTLVTTEPLDAATLADLLRGRFGADPHPEVVDLLLARSGGSPGVLKHLADAAVESGLLVVVDRVLVPDPARPGTSTRLLAGLPDAWPERGGESAPIQDLLHLAAMLGQLDAAEARGCCGEEAVATAVTHGVLTLRHDLLKFTVPAEGTLIAWRLSSHRRIELFDRFVYSVPRTLAHPAVAAQAAGWWRSTGRLLPVGLAAHAARHANLLGAYRRALVYSDPAVNDQHELVAPLERGFAFNELGDPEGVMEVFRQLDPIHLSEDELLAYLRVATLLEDDVERARLTHRAVVAGDPERRRSREVVRTLADLTSRSWASGDEKLAHRMRSVAFSTDLSTGNRAVAFASLSSVLLQAGRPDQAVESADFALAILAERQDAVTAYHLDMAREVHILSLMSALDLQGADHALREYASGVFARTGSGRLAAALQTYVSMGRGDIPAALAASAEFLAGVGSHDPHQVRGWVEAMTAECLVQTGRPDEARVLLAEANRHPSRVPHLELIRRVMLASTHDALAEPELAMEILGGVIDEARERHLLLTQIEAAGTAVLIGGPPQVGMLGDAVDHLVDPSGTPLIWQDFARAVRDYDIPAIVALADELDAHGARWFAGRVAQSVLDMARRATDLTPAIRDRMGRSAEMSGPGA
ncbi:hypothetical protein [Aeromicrobium wangtongii]|uniref:Uncharacterized protein n=1 Tax=Aeromicrobium wangtongii TaxID=2969247 RepID=A0ABY5M7A1_9ACTN|nr:hypothetical protein [Aeromicrobium wangtongii]MCD9199698.1 hypothetical protein [Aeromicrobium wangtongii]UUP14048.1 hypothetical protein NQV15_01690 [Aeromicrobium wangtongii]